MRPQPLSPEPKPPHPEPPMPTAPSTAAVRRWRSAWRWLVRCMVAALLSVLLFVAALFVRPMLGAAASTALVFVAAGVFGAAGLGGAIAAITALIKMRGADPRPPLKVRIPAWLFAVCGPFLFLFGSFIALMSLVDFGRGRQIRKRGKLLLPELADGGGWAHLNLAPGIAPELRPVLAAQWRENGRTEHASVAAFAKLTLDLLALGAPPRLLRDAQRDADDEIRHAELCFSLARGLDGEARSPAPFAPSTSARRWLPGRALRLAHLAVDSLIDGALHEGVSARVIAKLVRRCEVLEIRAVLKELAADEGKHCAHGWDVVEWCVAEGGWPVGLALRGAIGLLNGTLRTPKPEAAAAGEWERFGIPGDALEAEEYARACAELVRRVEPLCATPVAA